MISMERKAAKAISDSLYPLPDAIISPKVENWLFPPLVHPHGQPHGIFFIFSDRMCWVEYSFTPFKQKIGIFLIFFKFFCPFSEKQLFGPFTPILHPPMDHPTLPVTFFRTPTFPEPNQPINDFEDQKNLIFFNFLGEIVFLPFLAIWGSGDPPSRCWTKDLGALGCLLRVPSPFPDLTLSPKLWHHILFSPGNIFDTHQIKRLLVLVNFFGRPIPRIEWLIWANL